MASNGKKPHIICEPAGDEVHLVTIQDDRILDDHNVQEIGDALFTLVDDRNCTRMVLNFDHVQYLSSAALGKLITLNNKIRNEGGRLILSSIRPQIY
jgi:anti-sigma B factor antagonist